MDMESDREIPQLDGHWLLGSLPDFKKAPHAFLANARKQGHELVRFRMLHTPMIGVVGANCAETIFKNNSQNYPRGKQRKPLESLLGLGLVNLEGDTWKQHRRLIAQGFKPDFLKFTLEQNSKLVTRLLDRWEKKATAGEPVEVGEEMRQFTLAVIIKALFSVDLDWDQYEENYRAIIDANNLLFKRYVAPIKAPEWMPTPLNRKLAKAREAMNSLAREHLEAKRSEPERQTHDIGDHFLALHEAGEMTMQEILDEIRTLLVAGFETTATALAWTLYLIGRNPQVTDRWYEELEGILGDKSPTWENISKLKYTEHLLMESLRLYPPVYMLSRMCQKDDLVQGYTVPAGTPVLLSIYSIHRSPEVWAEPESFKPERYDTDWPEQAFLPFGIGKHICIGSRFSMLESILILACIGQRFKFSLVENKEIPPDAKVTLVPSLDIWLKLDFRS